MFEANPAGAGVAWREGVKKGDKVTNVVKWEKGLALQEIRELCKSLPLPYVAHFRIPTVGGPKKALCHPFPIEKNVSLELKGTTHGYVLFHNGHWGRWKEFSLDSSAKNGFQVPTGKWSDSRAMAWAAAYHGLGILEFIDEKAIAFGPNDIEVFGGGIHGNAWTVIGGGIYVSNTSWQYTSTNFNRGGSTFKAVCMYGNCKADRIDGSRYCAEHPNGQPLTYPPALPPKKEGTGELSSNNLGASGGSSTQTPFREVQGGRQVVQGESDQSEEVEEGSQGMARLGPEALQQGQEEASGANGSPTLGGGPADGDMYAWACSINAKPTKRTILKLVDTIFEPVTTRVH